MPNIIGRITPDGDTGTFPVAYAEHLRGGLHVVADNTARDLIAAERRVVGMEVNIANGTKYKLVGGLANANYQLVTGGAATACAAIVDLAGVDATASIGGSAFRTFAVALAAVLAASPSASNPLAIVFCPGVHTVSLASLTISSPYISIVGAGINTTIINFAPGNELIIDASYIALADLTLQRTGVGSSRVLHVNTTSLETYRNTRLDRLKVRNDSGTAIGTFSGDGYDIEAYGKTAIDWCYGARLHDPHIVGHDPDLSQTSYAIKRIQSISLFGGPGGGYGGLPVYDIEERYIAQRGGVVGGEIINTDPNGICVMGLSESHEGDFTSSDWFLQGGQPLVSWFPSPIRACQIIGPNLLPGTSDLNLGTHARGAGSGGALRGTLRVLNCEVYASLQASYLHDSDVQGGCWITENGRYGHVFYNVQACSFTSVSFIWGDNEVGYLDGLRRIHLSSGNIFRGCHNQGELAFVLGGDQYQIAPGGFNEMGFRDTEYTSAAQKRSSFGWDYPESQCVRLNGLGDSFLKTAGINNGDYAASLVARTFELWFRCDNTLNTEQTLFTYTGDTLSAGTVLLVNPSTGHMYGYAAGLAVGDQTGLSFANATATIVCQGKTYLAQGEYIDLAYGGATNRFWFDKVGDSSGPPANPGTLTRVNLSGAADTATGTGAALRTAINTLLSATLDSSETAGIVTVARRVTGALTVTDAVATAEFLVTNITAHWHHVQLSVTGGTGTIYLDGVAITGSAGSIPVITGAGALRIGVSNTGIQRFKGDIAEVRVSNVARDPALRKTHWMLDSNTLGLWSDSTRRPLGWTDQTGAHDMHFGNSELLAHSNAPNIPYWVRRNRTLEWLHATQA